MRSILTRVVFRRLLRNEPIIHKDCLFRYTNTLKRHGRRITLLPQRRTLFGFTRARPREIKEADVDPGLDVLMEACKSMDMRMRLPNPNQLAEAWRMFFIAKAAKKGVVNDLQANYAWRVYQHLQKLSTTAECKEYLGYEDLRLALKVLSNVQIGDRNQRIDQGYVTFAKELYAGIQHHPDHQALIEEASQIQASTTTKGKDENRSELPSSTMEDDLEEQDSLRMSSKRLVEPIEPSPSPGTSPAYTSEREKEPHWPRSHLIRIMCASGDAKGARALITNTKSDPYVESLEWISVVHGFARLRDGKEVRNTIEMSRAQSTSLSRSLRRSFVLAFAEVGDMESLKSQVDLSQLQPLVKSFALREVLLACIKHNEIEWGRAVVRSITESGYLQTNRILWDAIFVWALGTGKGVDEINRMMNVMQRTNSSFAPNNNTIHQLIEFANSRNDPYLAERIMELGRTWKVPPDAKTYLLQMDCRLSVGDIEGARTSYQQVQLLDPENNEDLPRINQLIQAMCNSKKYTFDTIMTVVEDLNGRNSRFPPETVAALASLHLNRDEYHDVVDLLNTHVHHFSADDRGTVRDRLFNVCLDRNNNIARVWDTYMIYQRIFDEATREPRTRIMEEFFARDRSDMAVHVFNHMREHSRDDTIPTTETYCATLVGIGKLNDEESLEVVHNALKIDMNIEPSTRIFNALMLAYLGCEKSRRALTFWDEIVSSKEGPSYESLLIVFKVTEAAPFGERKALQVWKQLRNLDVEMTRDLVAAYTGALTGNLLYDEAKDIIQGCEEEFGIEVDAVILGTFYNATRNESKQDEMEKWIKETYPAIYEELLKLGKETDDEDIGKFNVSVPLKP